MEERARDVKGAGTRAAAVTTRAGTRYACAKCMAYRHRQTDTHGCDSVRAEPPGQITRAGGLEGAASTWAHRRATIWCRSCVLVCEQEF